MLARLSEWECLKEKGVRREEFLSGGGDGVIEVLYCVFASACVFLVFPDVEMTRARKQQLHARQKKRTGKNKEEERREKKMCPSCFSFGLGLDTVFLFPFLLVGLYRHAQGPSIIIIIIISLLSGRFGT